MGRLLKIAVAGAVFAGAGALVTAAASAQTQCPTRESFFGTIQHVSGNMLNVQTASGHGATVRIDSGARVNANGNTMRAGTYMGAYGCVTPNGVFHASEVTLSANAAGYRESLSGVVYRVENGRLLVRENGGGSGIWYVPGASGFRAGQSVTGTGMLSHSGAFYPQTVNGRNVAYAPASGPAEGVSRVITLSGVVRSVNSGSLLVWETAQRQSGTWVVRDARRFRVGQRVTGTGREDRAGRFYPTRIAMR